MAKLKIKPLQDRVLIKPSKADVKNSSGIIIPDSAQEKPQNGTVMAVGSGKQDEPMEVKVGDKVMYGKYAGTEMSYQDEEYVIMRQSDIIAIV